MRSAPEWPVPAAPARASATRIGRFQRLWLSSIRVRYLVVSLLAAVLPLGIVVALYDRYTENLVETLTGERLESGLTATSSKLADFLRSRIYQLESLADYPQFGQLVRADTQQIDPRLMAVLRYEVDSPDLYGIVFFDAADRVVATLAGQGAAGSSNWPGDALSIARLPRVEVQGVDLIGPLPPRAGQPGWFLLRRRLPGEEISVALQVRLASLTELLGAHAASSVYRPLLLTPDGAAFTAVGTVAVLPPQSEIAPGPPIAPGWRPALARDPDRLLTPSAPMRYALIALGAASVGAIVWLFFHLSARMRRQVAPLVEGAQAVARGDLNWRIPARGADEIATLAGALNHMSGQLRALIHSRIEVEKRAMLGDVVTGIAHEVRNPLATIKASMQALMMSERDAERREMLGLIGEEIERINGVIETLLGYARPRSPEQADVPVRELLRRIEALTRPMADEANVRIAVSGDRELALHVDAGQVQQILMNLVMNAIQAMPRGGSVSLRAYREGSRGVITVTDTGDGIAPELIDKVTEPFFTTRSEGTGLGLAVSRQLAELNGGSLALASAPGEGTIVTLKLPLAQGQQ